MRKNVRYTILAIILVLLVVCAIISVSYGYYTISGNESHEIVSATDIPACASLKITDNKLIKLEGDYAVPLKEEQVLNSSSTVLNNFKYSFTVTNNCSEEATMSIGIAPLTGSNISVSSLKYVIVKSGDSLPTKASQFDRSSFLGLSDEMKSHVYKTTGSMVNVVHNFSSISVEENSSVNYDLYLWIDYNEDNINTMDKNFSAILILNDFNKTFPTLASYVTNDVYKSETNKMNLTVKKAGLYKHDASLVNGAKDNAYRYSGADGDVNNWVCFEGDDCTNENNLYRIISVDSSGVTKIIKATSLGNKKWNEYAGYEVKGTAEEAAQNLTSSSYPSSYTNIWAINTEEGEWYTSSLNDYLNNDYLPTMEAKTDKIVTTTWSVAGYKMSENTSKNAFEIYEIETSNKAIYPAKVGLMYAYEYMYAALPAHWHKVGYNSSTPENGYNSVGNDDWMKTTNNPWMISRDFADTFSAFFVLSGGGYVRSSTITRAGAVNPVFSLSSSAKLLNATAEGVGSKTTPMIIK